MVSSALSRLPAPVRWFLRLAVGVGVGVVVGFAVGLARPRAWPDPAALG